MNPRRVVVGIASPPHRVRVAAMLVSLGYEVALAESCSELLDLARSHPPHVVITDQEFLADNVKGLLPELRERLPGTPLVVLPQALVPSEPGRPDAGVSSMPEPELMEAIERVLGTIRGGPAQAQRPRPALDPFVGQSPAIRRLAEEALKALGSESPILIEGETGTGKGVLTKWLHRHGSRAHEEFVDLNCAGFTRELMDSELFGHEKGSFTGAVNSKVGLLEVADKGTLFLDEIGDMEPPIQAKLLKVIEEKRFRRVGETRERHTDVRVIAATHHNLLQRVREGLFRADLYYRIGVLRMRMPAMRFRSHDISALARRIITELAIDLGRPEPVLTPDAEKALMGHAWPGNVRELRNELEQAMLESTEGPIERRHLFKNSVQSAPLPADVPQPGFGDRGRGTLEEMERAYIKQVLEEEQHVERAAQRLGIARSTFYQKLRTLGISSRR